MIDTISIPKRLDNNSVSDFLGSIKEKIGQPIQIEAGEVTYIGALGLQTLVLAKKKWADDKIKFQIVNATDAVRSAAQTLGIDLEDLGLTDAKGVDHDN